MVYLLQTKYTFFYRTENVVQDHLQALLIKNQHQKEMKKTGRNYSGIERAITSKARKTEPSSGPNL